MKTKIVAIDDQPENLRLIVEILKQDYSVIAATSGEKGLQLAVKDPLPGVILLDVFMPEMDGFMVLESLKKNPETMNIPVIFVTGDSDEETYKKGLKAGATDFVQKPVSPALLKQRIKNSLA